MMIRALPYRYAKALIYLAKSEKELEKRQKNLDEFLILLRDLPKFKQFLLNPEISNTVKKRLLQENLKEILDPILIRFLFFLLENGRFNYINAIAKEYRKMTTKTLGILDAYLITTVPIDTSIKTSLKAKIEMLFQKPISFHESLDPEILGGMTVIVGNQIIDYSLKNRLENLKKYLQGRLDNNAFKA